MPRTASCNGNKSSKFLFGLWTNKMNYSSDSKHPCFLNHKWIRIGKKLIWILSRILLLAFISFPVSHLQELFSSNTTCFSLFDCRIFRKTFHHLIHFLTTIAATSFLKTSAGAIFLLHMKCALLRSSHSSEEAAFTPPRRRQQTLSQEKGTEFSATSTAVPSLKGHSQVRQRCCALFPHLCCLLTDPHLYSLKGVKWVSVQKTPQKKPELFPQPVRCVEYYCVGYALMPPSSQAGHSSSKKRFLTLSQIQKILIF